MKKNLFYAGTMACAMSLLASCNNEDLNSFQQNDGFKVTAGMGIQSRTAVEDELNNEGEYDIVWSAGDGIYLYGEKSYSMMTLVEGSGTSEASFSGRIYGYASDFKYAIYPVPAVNADGTFGLELAAEKDWSDNSGAPMFGNYDKGHVSFDLLTAMFRVNVDVEAGETLTLTMTDENDEAAVIAGKVTISADGEIVMDAEGETAVSVTFAKAGNYMLDIPVPAGQYTGYKVENGEGVVIAETTFATPTSLSAGDIAVVTSSEAPEVEEDATEIVIMTAAELRWFAEQVNGGETFKNKTVKLGADIDLASLNWTPIGDCESGNYFQGTFDGGDYTISGLYVDKSTNEYKNSTAGLFGWIDAGMATIQNVKVDRATVKGSHWTGVIAGYATGKIENCEVSNSVVEGYNVNDDANGDKIGGIVGYLNDDSYLNSNKVTKTTISGNRDLGGIAGAVASSTKEMNNNTVEDVTLTYTTTKSYGSAGDIVSGRTGYIPNNTNVATNVTKELVVETAEQLQNALTNAIDGEYIVFANDITGNATVPQKENVKITIDGRKYRLSGAITVDGRSARYETAALDIKDVNFRGGCETEAYINLGSGVNATRYTNNVTVKGCTFDFDGEGDLVAVKSYTGGDWNLKIDGCEVSKGMHSLLQVANVEKGLEITDCKVYSKNGININSTPGLLMDGCTFETQGYAARFGVNGKVDGSGKTFTIKHSTLKSACDEGDAVIIFRDNAKKCTLILENTSVIGTTKFSGDIEETKIVEN